MKDEVFHRYAIAILLVIMSVVQFAMAQKMSLLSEAIGELSGDSVYHSLRLLECTENRLEDRRELLKLFDRSESVCSMDWECMRGLGWTEKRLLIGPTWGAE